MAIQNDNTLVTKGDLKDLFANKIAPYLGANLALKSNVSEFYSTDEKIIGVWIDGKPLYQKTYSSTVPTATTEGQAQTKTIQLETTQEVRFIEGTIYNPSTKATNKTPSLIPDIVNSATVLLADVYINTTNQIVIRNNRTNQSGREIYITLKYTKTTDAANSATTTPGCYDINFPNTWPENKEIYFGNGLYGQRFIGNTPDIVAGGNRASIQLSPASTFTNARMFSFGGNITAYNSSDQLCIHPIGSKSYNNGVSPEYQGYHIDSGIYFTGDGRLLLGMMAGDHHITTSNTYDIWVTYKK